MNEIDKDFSVITAAEVVGWQSAQRPEARFLELKLCVQVAPGLEVPQRTLRMTFPMGMKLLGELQKAIGVEIAQSIGQKKH